MRTSGKQVRESRVAAKVSAEFFVRIVTEIGIALAKFNKVVYT